MGALAEKVQHLFTTGLDRGDLVGYLEGFDPSEPAQEGIERFISGRQLTNHPVAISVWDKGSMWDRLQGHYELIDD